MPQPAHNPLIPDCLRESMDWRHNRLFRIALLLVVTLVALVGIVPYFVSVDSVRSELAAQIARSTRRKLDVRGDIHVIVLPRPALLLNDVALTEPDSDKVFARAGRVKVGLALWPLLTRGEALVRELVFDGAMLAAVRREDGSYNFDDLLAQSGDDRLQFGVEHLRFKSANLRLYDEFLGNNLWLSGLDARFENLADPKTGHLELSGALIVGKDGKPEDWRGRLSGSAAMRYSASDRRLLVADLDVKLQQEGASSDALRVANASLSVTGNLVYGWRPLRLTGGELKLAGEMQRADQKWKTDIDLPEIRFKESHLDLGRLKLQAAMQSPAGGFSVQAQVPALAGARHGVLRADTAQIEVKLTSPEQNLALNFVSPLELQQGTQIVLPGYRLEGSYGNRNLPRGVIPFDLLGDGRLDLRGEYAELASQGTVDRSPVTAGIRVDDFVAPRYRFDVDLARLDLSPYLPAVAENAKAINPDEPFDLWWLDKLEAQGSIKIGELVMRRLHVNNLSGRLTVSKRKFVVDPLFATIYEGQLTGRAEVDASRRAPAWRLQQRLSNMNINALLSDVMQTNRFEGRGHLDLDVAAVGRKISDLRKTAGGGVRLVLNRGAIRGIDVESVLRAANRQLKLLNGESAPVQPANLDARTSFSELRASLVLRHGIASNNDLAVTAGVLKLTGGGTIDLDASNLDYVVKASANPKVPELANLAGLVLPIQFSGALSAPDYKVDYASLREQIVARKKAQEEAKARSAAKKGASRAKKKTDKKK